MPGIAFDPGSFRDPDSRVLLVEGQVFRGLSATGAADWHQLAASPFFAASVERGDVVATDELSPDQVPESIRAEGFSSVLRHQPVPFVSYPYEWSFSMLRDAASLHLELVLGALDHGLTMKDGTSFNVQWRGTRPVFIDVGSFEPAAPGPWVGYRQFCETFLYPLMLRGLIGIDFQSWLRGSVHGVPLEEIRALLGWRHVRRPGVLRHVLLHAAVSARVTERAQETRRELADAGFSTELASAAVKNLLKATRRLRWKRPTSHWHDYHDASIYGGADRAAKERFVAEATASYALDGCVYDLGCNDGAYSRVAADRAAYVVAVDHDHAVIERLYHTLREEGNERILPLVMDLTDPSPGLGWRSSERASFLDRARPNLVLAAALVHHLSIAGGVPLDEVVAWLRDFGAALVVEFPHPDDPFVERLLANKPPSTHDGYGRHRFEAALADRFTIERAVELPCGTRTLYLATV